MSGAKYQHRDWQDQLSGVRGDLLNQYTSHSGFVSSRHRRSGRSNRNKRERDPFEGVVFPNSSDSSIQAVNNVSDASEAVSGSNLVSEQDPVTDIINDYGDEEVFMSNNNRDQSLSGDEDKVVDSSSQGNLRGKQESEEPELSEEEKAELERKRILNRKIQKGAVYGVASCAALAVATCGLALIHGLLGRHRSNIMNM